jgi:hypothetical protein
MQLDLQIPKELADVTLSMPADMQPASISSCGSIQFFGCELHGLI